MSTIDDEGIDTPEQRQVREAARTAEGNLNKDVEITEDDILQAISDIRPKKASGSDGMECMGSSYEF